MHQLVSSEREEEKEQENRKSTILLKMAAGDVIDTHGAWVGGETIKQKR